MRDMQTQLFTKEQNQEALNYLINRNQFSKQSNSLYRHLYSSLFGINAWLIANYMITQSMFLAEQFERLEDCAADGTEFLDFTPSNFLPNLMRNGMVSVDNMIKLDPLADWSTMNIEFPTGDPNIMSAINPLNGFKYFYCILKVLPDENGFCLMQDLLDEGVINESQYHAIMGLLKDWKIVKVSLRLLPNADIIRLEKEVDIICKYLEEG